MTTILPILLVLGVIVAVVVVWRAATCNGLVGLREAEKNAWAQIRRAAQASSRPHSQSGEHRQRLRGAREGYLFERVTAARASATTATSPAAVIKAKGELSSALISE